MCNEIDFNVIFMVVPLKWIVVNIDGIFIVMILLLWTEMVLLCCDFTIFASWRDKKYQNILEKKNCFTPMELLMNCKISMELEKKLHDHATNNYR